MRRPRLLTAARPNAQDFSFKDAQGQTWRAYADRLDNEWGVVAQQPESELLGPLRVFQAISWGALGFGMVFLLALFSLSIRQALQPLDSLSKTVTALAAGDLSHTAPVESEDELGRLAEAFNAMTNSFET